MTFRIQAYEEKAPEAGQKRVTLVFGDQLDAEAATLHLTYRTAIDERGSSSRELNQLGVLLEALSLLSEEQVSVTQTRLRLMRDQSSASPDRLGNHILGT